MQYVVIDTTKVQIFKQITTDNGGYADAKRCYRYHKGTDFQANHNILKYPHLSYFVVIDTTKVQIFKQITTHYYSYQKLFCCYRYHKGTDFQANHNNFTLSNINSWVVIDTTKVQIFKQITTIRLYGIL